MSESEADTPRRRRRWLPWVVTVVLAVLVALITAVLPHVHAVSQDARAEAAQASAAVALPNDYQDAVLAGATEAANLLTYARKTFDADWQRSLDGATGDLRKDHESQKATALKNITDKKIDLTAKVQHSAFESADEKGNVLVLVTVNGFIVNDKGVSSVAIPQRLEMTMVKSGGKWLATNLSSIGIQ